MAILPIQSSRACTLCKSCYYWPDWLKNGCGFPNCPHRPSGFNKDTSSMYERLEFDYDDRDSYRT